MADAVVIPGGAVRSAQLTLPGFTLGVTHPAEPEA